MAKVNNGGSSAHDEMERFGEYGYTGDESGLRIKAAGGRKFIALRWDDIHAATGEDTGDRHVVEVVMVDLDTVGEGNIASAIRSCGPDDEDIPDIGKAEACIQYGCHAPLESFSGGNLRKLVREAKRAALEYIEDDDKLEERLDGAPVNAVGSTPREFMRGDFTSAMSRGLAQGNPNARILAQMHAPIPQGGVSASVALQDDDLGTLSKGDPIAYTMGFLAGFQGTAENTPRDELAQAYLDGRAHGADVRLGRKPKPSWIN